MWRGHTRATRVARGFPSEGARRPAIAGPHGPRPRRSGQMAVNLTRWDSGPAYTARGLALGPQGPFTPTHSHPLSLPRLASIYTQTLPSHALPSLTQAALAPTGLRISALCVHAVCMLRVVCTCACHLHVRFERTRRWSISGLSRSPRSPRGSPLVPWFPGLTAPEVHKLAADPCLSVRLPLSILQLSARVLPASGSFPLGPDIQSVPPRHSVCAARRSMLDQL